MTTTTTTTKTTTGDVLARLADLRSATTALEEALDGVADAEMGERAHDVAGTLADIMGRLDLRRRRAEAGAL